MINENVRFLSAYYCYLTDKNTVLHITNPECEADGDGYIVAEYKRDHNEEIDCINVLYNVETWEDIEKEYNITKCLGCGWNDEEAMWLLDMELNTEECDELIAA